MVALKNLISSRASRRGEGSTCSITTSRLQSSTLSQTLILVICITFLRSAAVHWCLPTRGRSLHAKYKIDFAHIKEVIIVKKPGSYAAQLYFLWRCGFRGWSLNVSKKVTARATRAFLRATNWQVAIDDVSIGEARRTRRFSLKNST